MSDTRSGRWTIDEGSYTVEASLVMTLIILLLVAILSFGMGLHDRQVVFELGEFYVDTIALMNSGPVDREGRLQTDSLTAQSVFGVGTEKITEEAAEEMAGLFVQAADARTYLLDVTSAEISVDSSGVSLCYSGTIRTIAGGLVEDLLADTLAVEGVIEKKKTLAPGTVVRLCRGLLFNVFSGG